MRPKELMKLLSKDGWKIVRTEGSHHIHKHPSKPGTIPVALHNKEMSKGLVGKILKDAGLKY